LFEQPLMTCCGSRLLTAGNPNTARDRQLLSRLGLRAQTLATAEA